MIQLAVQANNGQPGARRYLDLYDTDPIKLNLSIEDITTTDTTAVYSQTFRIPATGNNSAFFVSMFDVNGFDFDISQRHPAEIIIDSDIYQSGEIRLLKVYVDDLDNQIDYEIVFLGTVRDFASSLGESSMCQLDTTDIGHFPNTANIELSWDAYPETPATDPNYLTAGLSDGNVIYPLIDFGNTYDDNLVVEQTRIALGSGIHFTQNSHPMDVDRLRPGIRAKYLWDKIFENAGYTYESNFLNSNLFQHLYLGAFGQEATIILDGIETAGRETGDDEAIPIDGTQIQLGLTLQSNPGGNFDLVNDEYVVTETGNISVSVALRGQGLFGGDNQGTIGQSNLLFSLWRQPAGGGAPVLLTISAASMEAPVIAPGNFAFRSYTTSLSAPNENPAVGDSYFVRVAQGTFQGDYLGADTSGRENMITVRSNTAPNPATGFDCDYLQIDFIKDIITKFRLVVSPDKNVKDKFIIEPWTDYVAAGDQLDWTSKMDLSKDVIIQPILYTQKEKIKFEDKEGEDVLNVLNQTDIGETYGTLNFNSNSPLLKGERKIDTKLEPCPTTQVDGASESNNGADNMIIPKIHDVVAEVNNSGNSVLLRNPCKPGVKLFWYDGMKHSGTTSARDVTWYITDGTTQNSHTKYPMASEFNEWGDRDDSFTGLDSLTQTLNWQKENTYIRFGLANPGLGLSTYNVYWDNYINSLYNPFSRRLTVYLRLDKFDLLNFSFDDAIFLKNAWYYVEKIYNLDMTKESSVKVDLIRLDNFVVNKRNFIPPSGLPQLWENISDNWEAITTNWENV